jgi:ATP-dependent DNA helicase RecG
MKEFEVFEKLKIGEKGDFECKAAKGGLPGSLWETYSAMANTNGGSILLGVSEQDGQFIVSGVLNAENMLKDFWNTINNKGKVSMNILKDSDVNILEVDGYKIISIDIPRADYSQKPVYIGQNPLNGTYKRGFEGDYKCSETEVKAMFADQNSEGQDLRVLEYFGIDDLDMDTIKSYRNRFAALNPDHPWIDLELLEFLKRLQVISIDRKTGKECITAAGLLLFGKSNSITEAFPEFFLDYRENLSDDPEVRWTDRIWPDGRWETNLYQFYFKVIGKLTDGLKIPFRMENLVRIDETHVHQALKEAFVNCIIHADYNLPTGIVIIRDRTGYTFSNAGRMKIPPEVALQGGNSVPRNKTIQKLFGLINLGERAGSGLPKILRAWNEQHWRNIELKEETIPDKTVLRLWTVSLIPDEAIVALKQLFGTNFNTFKQNIVTTLVTAYLEGSVTNRRLQQISGEHSSDITKLLQSLVEKGYLITNNKAGRGTVYHLNKDYKESSIDKEINSVDKKVNSVDNGINSVDKEQMVDDDKKISLITEEARAKKRLKPEAMRKIILLACTVKPLSLKNLAELLDRNADNLRVTYISKMVKEGALQLLFPDEPNHPNQAYYTKRI